LRRARIFASQGRSHLAEVEINQLLQDGTPVSEVSEAIGDLPASLATRRQALQRSAALLAGGVLMGSGIVSARPAAAAPESPLAGLFTMTPLMNGTDNGFAISRITSGGVRSVPGTYRGYAFVSGGSAYVLSQSWDNGTPVTTTDIISPDGPTRHLTTIAGRSPHGSQDAVTTGSLATACKRGPYLYVASTWTRTYRMAGTAKPGLRSPRIRVTTQQALQVIDSTTGTLVASWTGPQGQGACLMGLKVSADGGGIVLSTDTPDQVPRAGIRSWQFDGAAFRHEAAVAASPDLVYALARHDYHWPAWSADLIQAGSRKVYSYSVPTNTDRISDLAASQEGGNVAPNQAVADSSGSLVISNGDGRYVLWRPGTAVPQQRALATGGPQPAAAGNSAFPVYSGQQLRDILAVADSSVWLIDNREGVGGIWRLSLPSGTAQHELGGNYLAGCAADDTGSHVAALSPIESTIYLIGPSGDTQAFKVPARTEFISRS
jgi:hypothetical protein